MLKSINNNKKIMFNQNENWSDSSNDNDPETSEDELDDVPSQSHIRGKRDNGVPWCGVGTENTNRYRPPGRVVVWPPPSTSSSARNYIDPNTATENPVLGTKMQLYSRTGYLLAVYPDGKVRGTDDENDLHTYLEIHSGGYPGHVKIRGILTNLYIAMNKRGRLYGEPNPMEESIVFIEAFQGSYNTYLSRKYAHQGWYIGLRKSGKVKKGPKTKYGQKAIKFLPRRSKFE